MKPRDPLAKNTEKMYTKLRSRFLRYRHGLLLMCWCLIIFVLSSVPGNRYPQVQWEYSDKAVHVCLYLAGGVFSAMWFSTRQIRLSAAILFCIFYGLTDELHQLLVPRRSFSLSDLAADSIGSVIGVTLFAAVSLFRPAFVSRLLTTETFPDTPERMKTT